MRVPISGVLEIVWAIRLSCSDGLSRPLPTLATVIALVIGLVLLSESVETLTTGTAIAVWTGIGAVGTATLGQSLFDEPISMARLGFIAVSFSGTAGPHLV